MKVNIVGSWFTPHGTLILARDNPHEVPDEWNDPNILPPLAEVIEEEEEAPKSKKGKGLEL